MSKPKFNPNQQYEVAQESKPKFDPMASFESADEPKTSAFEAFHKNASDSALLGYAPQVRAGAIDPLVEKIGNFFTGDDVDMGDYLTNRDEYRKNIETAQSEHPGAALAGTVTGAAATSLVPGLNAAKGVTTGARIANAAKTGAMMGAALNPGDTEGEFSGLQLGDRLMNSGKGALFSGGLQGLGEGAIKGAAYLKDKGGKALKDVAEKMAFKSGGAMLKDFRNATDRGTINETGRYILDNGLKIGDSVDDIAGRATAHNEVLGSKLDDLYNQAGAMFKEKMNGKGFDPIRDKEEILQAARQYLGNKVGADAAVNKLGGYLDEVAARHGDAPMQAALAKYGDEVADYIPKKRQFLKDERAYKNSLGKAGENLDQAVLPGMADDFQRTGTGQRQIELHGQEPSLMRPQGAEYNTQMDLLELPTGNSEAERLFALPGEANFGHLGGETADRLGQRVVDSLEGPAQLDFIDQNFKKMMVNQSKQGAIDGTELVPRSFQNVDDIAIQSGKGQMQFPIAPNAPARPVRPDDIRNPMSPRAANNIKSSLDEAINYSRSPLSKDPASELAYSAARNKINQKNLEAIESLGGGELADALKATNKEYGLSKQVSRMANDMVNRQDGHKFFGLTDVIAGGAGATYGAVTGDWQTALLGMAAKKGLDKYGTTTLAIAADKLSKQLLQSPRLQQLAVQNPQAYGAMVYNLVERLENNGGMSMPRAADKNNGNTTLMDRYMNDPSVASGLQNDKLKEQLKKQQEKRNITKPVPVGEAQASFIRGN